MYSALSEVSGSKFVVDSSKDRTIALFFKKYRPQDVHIVFLHRSIKGIAASSKRLAKKKGKDFNMDEVFKQKQDFERTVLKYKNLIGDGAFTDLEYEDLVQFPAEFVNRIAKQLGSEKEIEMPNEAYFIEPNNSHIVAGNPMRYRGRQQVLYDDSWASELSDVEISIIDSELKKKGRQV